MCRGDLVEQVVLVTSRRSGQHLLELLRGDYIYPWARVCVCVERSVGVRTPCYYSLIKISAVSGTKGL